MKEAIAFALDALAREKLKSFLTVLGMSVGCCALVLVIMVATAGRTYITALIEGIGANLVIVEREPGVAALQDELSAGDLGALRSLPNIVAAAGSYDNPLELQIGTRKVVARLVGVTEDFQKIRNLRILRGRYFDAEDFSKLNKVCLVTSSVNRRLRHGAVGNELKLGDSSCTIIGIFEEGISTFGQSEIQNETILLPYRVARIITGDSYFQVIYLQVAKHDDIDFATQQVKLVVASRHRSRPRYLVRNMTELLYLAEKTTIGLTGILLGVSIVCLVTAGVGIMNIMFATVTERTYEIGLRKALGASERAIRTQFLTEAALLSAFGAAIGVLTGTALSYFGSSIIPNIPSIPSALSIIGATVFTMAVGIAFGYLPAQRAAKLQPVDSLRHE